MGEALRRHEPPDIPAARTLVVAAALFLCLLAVLFVAAMTLRAMGGTPLPPTPPMPPEPRLDVRRGGQLAELRAREDGELSTYGWIDRRAGVVRIPIERAMELLVERERR